jgi:hypothetical protein
LTSISKPPLFNYIAFIKNLDIDNIVIDNNFKPQHAYIVLQEIFKLLDQTSSLRELHFSSKIIESGHDVMSNLYFGTGDCLRHLTTLSCHSRICPEFLKQLSQLCHNIQSLKLETEGMISDGLRDLISVQKNLKCLDIKLNYCENLTDIIPSLTKHSNTLTKLIIYDIFDSLMSIIDEFKNLQELGLSFRDDYNLEILQNVIFHNYKLQNLNFRNGRIPCHL